MNNMCKVFFTGKLAETFSTAAIVYADTKDDAGGTWKYGYNRGISAYSDYYHPYNKHGAKVVNRNNGATGKANTEAGGWAKASIWDIWDPASFYYKPNGSY